MILLPPSAHQDTIRRRLLGGFNERATTVVLDAIKLQNMIQGVYVSYDYVVFFPETNVPYSSDSMEVSDLGPDVTLALRAAIRQARKAALSPGPTNNTVLLPVTLALGAKRIEPNRSRSEIVVKKAAVVALL